MNIAAFRIRFPEFETAPDSLVQMCLDVAAGETDAAAFSTAYDEAHGLLACHKLAISPYGQNARMVSDKGETTYGRERAAVETRMVTPLDVV